MGIKPITNPKMTWKVNMMVMVMSVWKTNDEQYKYISYHHQPTNLHRLIKIKV